MTIFNKDGKVYVLRGPNPLVKKQVSWDPSKLIFHNFSWDAIKINNSSKINKIQKKDEEIKKNEKEVEAEDIAKEKETFDDVAKEKETFNDFVETTPEAEESQEKKDFDLPYIKYKVLSYCLPAKVEKKADNFYGETWSKVKYEKKIIFPSVIINSSDFEFDFWTSDPREQITEKSIIYPFSYEVHNQETDKYDRVPYDEYRWWKVTEKEKKEGGWLFKCAPSETQPDFSD